MTLETPTLEEVIEALRGMTAGNGIGWDRRRADKWPKLYNLTPVRQARAGPPGADSDSEALLLVLNCLLPVTEVRPASELNELERKRLMLRVAFNLVSWPGGVVARRKRLLAEMGLSRMGGQVGSGGAPTMSLRTWMEQELAEIATLGRALHASVKYPCAGRSQEEEAALARRREARKRNEKTANAHLQLALLALRDEMSFEDAKKRAGELLEFMPRLKAVYRREFFSGYTVYTFLGVVLRALEASDYDSWRVAWAEDGPLPIRRLSKLLSKLPGQQPAWEAILRSKLVVRGPSELKYVQASEELDATFDVLSSMLDYYESFDAWNEVLPPHRRAHV